MAEDTWALNEGAIDEDAFLEQAWHIFAEREAMFLNALGNTRRGVVACVFDTSDRVQHMFLPPSGRRRRSAHGRGVQEMYRRMDALVGKAREASRRADGAIRAFRPWILRIPAGRESERVAAGAWVFVLEGRRA